MEIAQQVGIEQEQEVEDVVEEGYHVKKEEDKWRRTDGRSTRRGGSGLNGRRVSYGEGQARRGRRVSGS